MSPPFFIFYKRVKIWVSALQRQVYLMNNFSVLWNMAISSNLISLLAYKLFLNYFFLNFLASSQPLSPKFKKIKLKSSFLKKDWVSLKKLFTTPDVCLGGQCFPTKQTYPSHTPPPPKKSNLSTCLSIICLFTLSWSWDLTPY